jgi:hypothetical protein
MGLFSYLLNTWGYCSLRGAILAALGVMLPSFTRSIICGLSLGGVWSPVSSLSPSLFSYGGSLFVLRLPGILSGVCGANVDALGFLASDNRFGWNVHSYYILTSYFFRSSSLIFWFFLASEYSLSVALTPSLLGVVVPNSSVFFLI